MSNLNNLEKYYEAARSQKPKPLPTGTRREVGLKLIADCQERDTRLEKQALDAEREGDHDGCWLAMAARAENKRAMDKIKADLEQEEKP